MPVHCTASGLARLAQLFRKLLLDAGQAELLALHHLGSTCRVDCRRFSLPNRNFA